MNRFAQAVVVSLLCPPSFATSVSAECAWVLWNRLEDDRYKTIDWQTHAAYPSYARCWSKIQAYTSQTSYT